MNIPSCVIKVIEDSTSPLDNAYLIHAKNALEALNKVTRDAYCYDYMSNAINTLERYYKGFLKASVKINDWYELPNEKFLAIKHDLLGLVLEIKDNFPDALPKLDRDSWRKTKDFLKELRREYTSSRYETHPSFEEFKTVLEYVNKQQSLLMDYLNEKIKQNIREAKSETKDFDYDNNDDEYEVE